MGHFYETIQGTGINREQAELNAISQFYYENGHRCDIREVTEARLLKSGLPGGYGARSIPVEQWEFDIHYHA